MSQRFKIYITAFLAVILACSACKDVLNIKPAGVVLKEEALQTEQYLTNLINSTYPVIASDDFYGGRVQVTNELLGDLLNPQGLGGDESSVFNRATTASNEPISNLYKESYKAILRANTALENITIVTNEASRHNLEGQAKFIRAICHFETVRLFAQPYGFTPDNSHPGIPLRTASEPTTAVRATVKAVYDQVIKDLQDAEQLLPDENGLYPTKWSAKGFLARVYFQMNDFAKAYNYANQVIASGKFTFDTDYSKRFSQAGTTEAVFTLISERNTSIDPRFGTLRGFKSDVAIPTLNISRSFYDNNVRSNANDVRRTAFYETQRYTPLITLKKYNATRFDLPVIHLTEMMLIRAESAAELNQNLNVAIADLNQILSRAYRRTRSLRPNTGAGVIRVTARTERLLDLVGEGDRVQQLKRIGAKGENSQIRGAAWNCPGLVLPFPNGEVSTSNNFVQNPAGRCQ